MNLMQLQYFKTVAETNKMADAAKKMHVTPAAISIAISKLEEELGVRLFDRTAISVQLNDAGRVYLQTVNEVLKLLEEGEIVLRGGASVHEE